MTADDPRAVPDTEAEREALDYMRTSPLALDPEATVPGSWAAHAATLVRAALARDVPADEFVAVPVAWVDHDEDDGDLHETGFIERIDGDNAVINCDCGPRRVTRPLSALTLGSTARDVPAGRDLTAADVRDAVAMHPIRNEVDWTAVADHLNRIARGGQR